jgi:hypothetical protein
MKVLLVALAISLLAFQLQAQPGQAMAERQQARVQELIEILELPEAQQAAFRDAMARVQAMQGEAMRERAMDGERGARAERARERAQQQGERGQQRGNMRERRAEMTAEERAAQREQMQQQQQTRARMMERQGEIDAILSEVLNDEQLSRFHAEQARMLREQAGQMQNRGQGRQRD